VRYGDIPSPLRTGLSPGRSQRKLLTESFFILPGSQRRVEAGPTDEHLRNRPVVSLMDATLKHSCWDLEVIVVVGEGQRDDVLGRRRRLEQRHMEHWVDGGRRRQL
jgi:hypothetical protein